MEVTIALDELPEGIPLPARDTIIADQTAAIEIVVHDALQEYPSLTLTKSPSALLLSGESAAVNRVIEILLHGANPIIQQY